MLMDAKLLALIYWLETDLTHFASLVTEGSVATDDPIQPGFSDNDLQIIVYADASNEMVAVRDWLLQYPLGDTYLVSMRVYNKYIHGDTLNDISLKFRAKVLAGRDVVTEKSLPNRAAALQIGKDGLTALVTRLEHRWLNIAHWSDDYARHKCYEIYKNFFVFYAALHYGRTGEYPTSRADVAAIVPDQLLAQNVLCVTNNIAQATKEQQNLAIESAIAIIQTTVIA